MTRIVRAPSSVSHHSVTKSLIKIRSTLRLTYPFSGQCLHRCILHQLRRCLWFTVDCLKLHFREHDRCNCGEQGHSIHSAAVRRNTVDSTKPKQSQNQYFHFRQVWNTQSRPIAEYFIMHTFQFGLIGKWHGREHAQWGTEITPTDWKLTNASVIYFSFVAISWYSFFPFFRHFSHFSYSSILSLAYILTPHVCWLSVDCWTAAAIHISVRFFLHLKLTDVPLFAPNCHRFFFEISIFGCCLRATATNNWQPTSPRLNHKKYE